MHICAIADQYLTVAKSSTFGFVSIQAAIGINIVKHDFTAPWACVQGCSSSQTIHIVWADGWWSGWKNLLGLARVIAIDGGKNGIKCTGQWVGITGIIKVTVFVGAREVFTVFCFTNRNDGGRGDGFTGFGIRRGVNTAGALIQEFFTGFTQTTAKTNGKRVNYLFWIVNWRRSRGKIIPADAISIFATGFLIVIVTGHGEIT